MQGAECERKRPEPEERREDVLTVDSHGQNNLSHHFGVVLKAQSQALAVFPGNVTGKVAKRPDAQDDSLARVIEFFGRQRTGAACGDILYLAGNDLIVQEYLGITDNGFPFMFSS